MTGATVPLDGSFFEALDFHGTNFLPRLEVSDLKSQQFIYTHETSGLDSVHSEWANRGAEWSYGLNHLMRHGVRNRKERRPQTSEVHSLSIETNDGVVRSTLGLDRFDERSI